jgi:hypothetical protein
MLAGTLENPRGRSSRDTLSEVGIAHHQSSGWQRIASVPDDEFERYLSATPAGVFSARC